MKTPIEMADLKVYKPAEGVHGFINVNPFHQEEVKPHGSLFSVREQSYQVCCGAAVEVPLYTREHHVESGYAQAMLEEYLTVLGLPACDVNVPLVASYRKANGVTQVFVRLRK
jgi:hypothetical protein